MSCNKNTHVIQIKHLLTSEKNIFEALNFNKTSWLAEKVHKINFFGFSFLVIGNFFKSGDFSPGD